MAYEKISWIERIQIVRNRDGALRAIMATRYSDHVVDGETISTDIDAVDIEPAMLADLFGDQAASLIEIDRLNGELAAASAERDRLRDDLAATTLGRDQAIEARDASIAAHTAAAAEAARFEEAAARAAREAARLQARLDALGAPAAVGAPE